MLCFCDIADIFVPPIFGTINVLTKIGVERLQPSPKCQTFTIIHDLQNIDEH